MILCEGGTMLATDAKGAGLTRRKLLRSAAGMPAFASALPLRAAAAQPKPVPPLNRFSAPSNLKITDMRACTVAANYDYPIIRIDTNQGVYGLGEVFAAGVKGSALMLKAHIVGRNPLEITSILRSIRNSAGHNFWNSGYGAIGLALHDIAGKVYGAPARRPNSRCSRSGSGARACPLPVGIHAHACRIRA